MECIVVKYLIRKYFVRQLDVDELDSFCLNFFSVDVMDGSISTNRVDFSPNRQVH